MAQPALLEPISEDSLEPELSLYAGSTLAGSRCSDNSDSVITFKKYQAQNKDLNYDPTKDENLKDNGTPNVQLSGTIEDGSPTEVEQRTSSEIPRNESFHLDCTTSIKNNVNMHEPICLEERTIKNSSFYSSFDLSLEIDDEFVSESETPRKATIKSSSSLPLLSTTIYDGRTVNKKEKEREIEGKTENAEFLSIKFCLQALNKLVKELLVFKNWRNQLF